MKSAIIHHADKVIRVVRTGNAAECAITASWKRSLEQHGVDPAKTPHLECLTAQELRERREQSERLISVASEYLDHLHALLGTSGCGIFVTDANGLILETRITKADAALFNDCSLTKGADWSEAKRGTNGIGTCLAEYRTTVIHRDEHFCSCHTPMTCVSVPVSCPRGYMLGAIDVSTARFDHDPRMNALISVSVQQVVTQIEAKLFSNAFDTSRIVIIAPETGDTSRMVALDDCDRIVGATRTARRHLKLPTKGEFKPILFGQRGTAIHSKEKAFGFEKGEKTAIIRALTKTDGNVSQAARELHVGRATLYRRMKRLQLT